jgi:hypothetical protein
MDVKITYKYYGLKPIVTNTLWGEQTSYERVVYDGSEVVDSIEVSGRIRTLTAIKDDSGCRKYFDIRTKTILPSHAQA